MNQAQPFNFPVAFRDVHYVALLYKANLTAVHKLLASTGFKPALFLMRSPMVALGLIQYKDSDLGSYNEIILAIPVVPETCNQSAISNWLDLYAPFNRKKGGQYIIHIPVTTQLSVDAGVKCWGYPKTVMPINHHFEGHRLASTLKNKDESILLQASGNLGVGLPIPSMNLLTYSFLDGKTVKTTVDVDAAMKWHPFADIRISVAKTNHPIVQTIMDLGIVERKPSLAISAPHFAAKFHAPTGMS